MFYQALLIFHIILGFYSLLIVPVVFMFKTGSSNHKKWGKTFFYSMLGVGCSALALSLLKFNLFLLSVGVFTLYMVSSGYRAIFTKGLHENQKPHWIDWSITLLNLGFGLGLILYGIFFSDGNLQVLSLIFGGITVFTGLGGLKGLIQKPSDSKHWIYRHISGMLGAYIATWTAFSATNLDFMPTLWRWTWPSILGSIVIAYFIRRERKKGLAKA